MRSIDESLEDISNSAGLDNGREKDENTKKTKVTLKPE
jgi:hypothetical protein